MRKIELLVPASSLEAVSYTHLEFLEEHTLTGEVLGVE